MPVLASGGSTHWGDLLPRVLSALVMVPMALGCAWAGGWLWALALAVAAILLMREWLVLCAGRPAPLRIAGIFYIGVPVFSLVWLRGDPIAGRGNLLILLVLVWSSDILAYIVGRMVGGRKLAPSISPGKTWSGAVGGLVAAVLVGVGAALCYGGFPFRAGLLAATLGIAAQAGDLFESWIKRRLGVKDSGSLIPGHGGVLDRMDALLAASPLAALIAACLGTGVHLWH